MTPIIYNIPYNILP